MTCSLSIKLSNGNRFFVMDFKPAYYIELCKGGEFVGIVVRTSDLGLPERGALPNDVSICSKHVLFKNKDWTGFRDWDSNSLGPIYIDNAEYYPYDPYEVPEETDPPEAEVKDSGVLSLAELNALFGDSPPPEDILAKADAVSDGKQNVLYPPDTFATAITFDEFLKGPDGLYIYDGRTLMDIPHERALAYLYECYRKAWKCKDVGEHLLKRAQTKNDKNDEINRYKDSLVH
jgi:hypothetical protein